MKKALFFLLSFVGCYSALVANTSVNCKITIVGGGIVGALESYYAYKDAKESNTSLCITVYEKSDSFSSSANGDSTNTSYNIVPSLTVDEILSVVPRGNALVEKLSILFSQPGGIRVDDVEGVNTSASAIQFKEAVARYGSDKNHDDRTLALLKLGKKSMELWQQLYDEGDEELKSILEASSFNPCREPRHPLPKHLADGYRIDLLYGIPDAKGRALSMKKDYEKLGFSHCAILSPEEVMAIDPSLTDFCHEHSTPNLELHRSWNSDSVALWRPGGCIDTKTFLPKLYGYLKKAMGQYRDENGELLDRFQLQFGKQVVGVEFDSTQSALRITGLKFSDGTSQKDSQHDSRYVFCPGEAVGTLHHLGFHEPPFAGFAGASLLLAIPLTPETLPEKYKNFSHCMEVHNEGIVLAWQARRIHNHIFIGVAGTKAFYGNIQPNKNEAFGKNRNLVQLNMMNDVLPELISLACGYPTTGKAISAEELSSLEKKGIASRWVGRRAVAYDGFPTLGTLYSNNRQVANARCTTHLGSGGVSFGPGAVWISRNSELNPADPFVNKVLNYADSRRCAG